MIAEAQPITSDQTAHSDFTESLKQAVIEKTDNGRRIIDSVGSIMEGDAPNCTPWHQLEAAKLLRKLGIGIAPTSNLPSPNNPPLPQGEGWREGENPPHPVHPVSPGHQMSDAQTKFTNKLIRQVRIHTGDGASIVRYLTEIMEGEAPGIKGRDRLEAIKMLLGICLDSPSFPSAEDMLLYARCHPDCVCVCEDLPEDHPEVAKMHTPLTPEQREQIAEQQEERDRRIDEQIEQKKRADKARKLAQFHEPTAQEDRRIEREEQRERSQQKREQDQQQKKDRMRDLRERIGRETRFDTWHHHQQQEQERARSP